VDAQGRGRIHIEAAHIDCLAAIAAITVIAIVQATQGSGDTQQFALPPPALLQRHGLPLQRIHARQAADTGLVEFDHLCRALTDLLLRMQFPLELQQSLPEVIVFRFSRHGAVLPD
jgi:hypothetical protein